MSDAQHGLIGRSCVTAGLPALESDGDRQVAAEVHDLVLAGHPTVACEVIRNASQGLGDRGPATGVGTTCREKGHVVGVRPAVEIWLRVARGDGFYAFRHGLQGLF
jgi:hypothetical protein